MTCLVKIRLNVNKKKMIPNKDKKKCRAGPRGSEGTKSWNNVTRKEVKEGGALHKSCCCCSLLASLCFVYLWYMWKITAWKPVNMTLTLLWRNFCIKWWDWSHGFSEMLNWYQRKTGTFFFPHFDKHIFIHCLFCSSPSFQSSTILNKNHLNKTNFK